MSVRIDALFATGIDSLCDVTWSKSARREYDPLCSNVIVVSSSIGDPSFNVNIRIAGPAIARQRYRSFLAILYRIPRRMMTQSLHSDDVVNVTASAL